MQVANAIYQTEQLRTLEKLACRLDDITTLVLMQRAATAAAEFMHRRWRDAQNVAIFCGNGNNGGDGYELARVLHHKGIKVQVIQVGEGEMTPDTRAAFNECEKEGVVIMPFSDDMDVHQFELLVDAIAGMGVKKTLRSNILKVLNFMHTFRGPVLSLDLPTGVEADTGIILGDAVRANATITYLGYKLGLLTGHGIAYAGEVVLHDLQLPESLFNEVTPIALKGLFPTYATRYLVPRPRDWHKGKSGHVLVIGGDFGFAGAPRLAALAALRVGAGLVTLATRPEHAMMMGATQPEIMAVGVETEKDLLPLMKRATAIVLGPGLGQSDWGLKLWRLVIQSTCPLVVDADGLNILASHPCERKDWVLTPHPGEAGRLLGLDVEAIQNDRLGAVKALVSRYQGVSVLKGAGTLIYSADRLPEVCDKGNPGMATAGMGDLLAGAIGGLIAQGIPLHDAAVLGVLQHAIAGDIAIKDGERGMIATDLLPFIRRLSNYSL
ncbi:MAG: NAD(P)H-hydrate dehydratase [Gammaproteobacteria bacterium]|nr:NAD(P)H-hydrate dehydratase [Gammaproteobacteria bacterium]